MARVREIFRKLIDIGVPAGARGPETHRIRFTNILSFVSFILNVIYGSVYFYLGLGLTPLWNLAFGVANVIPILLNGRGNTYLARLTFVAITGASLIFLSVYLGLAVAVRPIFAALYIGALFLFELKDRRWIVSSVLIVTLFLAIGEVLGARAQPVFRLDLWTVRAIRVSFLMVASIVLSIEALYYLRFWERDRAELQALLARYKQSQSALSERESQLVMAMEIAEMATWELDLATGELQLSVPMKRMLGLAAEECPSRQALLEMIRPDDRPDVMKALGRWTESRQRILSDMRFRVLRRNGEERWIRSRGRILFDPGGKPIRILGISMDITREKSAEQLISVQTAKMVASSKLSALGEMAGGIAHEINNPLAIIHARAGRLAALATSGTPGPEVVASVAEQIESTALRISRIIKALRSFARDGENDPLQVTQVRQLVEETAEMCRERLKNHGIELRIDPIPESLVIRCRPVQISQVLLNLLNNAHDAVEALLERWIRISVSETSADVFIRVADSGPGITPEVASRIFEPFFTTKEFGRGTGLGLSISRGIIESHGGSLEVESPSAHTCFVIHLPTKVASKS